MNTDVELVLVEDKESDAELILRVLKKNKIANKIFHVIDGEEALDFLFAQGPHSGRPVNDNKIVLLDLKLPKVDGLEVLRQIKADERTKKIPVIILSASGENRDLESAYELGANSYVIKPIKFDDFSKVVQDLGIYWVLTNKRPRG